MKVLITGAGGMVGQSLVSKLVDCYPDIVILAVVRKFSEQFPSTVSQIVVKDLSVLKEQQLVTLMNAVTVVVHAAAKTTALTGKKETESLEFYRINSELTLKLAKAADKSAVKRFIFLSTAKVYGECSFSENGFVETDLPQPQDDYAKSKLEAEQALLALAKQSSIEIVIIRPPLVYGPVVKGNFLTLIKWVRRPVLLPLSAIHNKRSFIAVENLVNFIILCIDFYHSPEAKNEIFNVSDDQVLSTTNLVKEISISYGGKAWLVPAPQKLLLKLASLFGKEDRLHRLFSDLVVDNAKAKTILGWKPTWTILGYLRQANDLPVSVQHPTFYKGYKLQRGLDFVLSLWAIIVLSPIIILLYVLGLIDTGDPIFIQKRMGRFKRPFYLYKFRTMYASTGDMATHLVSSSQVTPLGRWLRKTKLDELPQLLNVLKGEMSLVGPRPNLYNQNDLIKARDREHIYQMLPGITGLAQIKKIDMSDPERLAKMDKEMVETFSIKNYFKYLFLTMWGKGFGDGIKKD